MGTVTGSASPRQDGAPVLPANDLAGRTRSATSARRPRPQRQHSLVSGQLRGERVPVPIGGSTLATDVAEGRRAARQAPASHRAWSIHGRAKPPICSPTSPWRRRCRAAPNGSICRRTMSAAWACRSPRSCPGGGRGRTSSGQAARRYLRAIILARGSRHCGRGDQALTIRQGCG
jgi:hypothetical protein